MFFTVLTNYLIILSIFGYSYAFKRFCLEKKPNIIVQNIDFFYGFLFLIFLAIFINFFSPLKYFTIPIILLGAGLFLISYKNKNYKINFLYYFIIVLLITFIAFYGRNNIDSPMYHLQIINWLNLHKINFGIANLGIRLGFNSSWHSFVALTNVTYGTFNAKYYISAIIFSVVLYEAIRFKSKINLSSIFLYLFFCYLFLFSYLHPIYYGIILNHIGNPERDIVSMFFYFFSFYVFIKIFEEKVSSQKKTNLINLLVISTFICATTRLTTLLILLLPIFVFYKNRNYKIFNNFNSIFVIIVGLLWMSRSFIISGCFIFPIEQTCFDTTWSVNIDTLIYMVDEAKRYTRTLPYLNGLGDYNYSLHTYDWLMPWIKDYLFTTALLQINLTIIVSFIILSILKIFFTKPLNFSPFKFEQHEIIILIILFFSLILWMTTPEIRYAWGLHFVIPCFLITFFIKKNYIEKIKTINQKFFLAIFGCVFVFFFTKNISVFKIEDFVSIPNRVHDFSKIRKIGTFEGIDIFYNHWKCADFKGVCVNIPKEDYNIEKKYSYTFFNKN